MSLFERKCREQRVPATIQRRRILETVMDLGNRPTADLIHAAVTDRLPQVSRTPVYRRLETVVRMGLISKACHPGSVVRYDSRTDNHHHLVCLHCDRVTNLPGGRLERLPIPDVSGLDFEISDVRVRLPGICHECREKEEA